MNWFISGCIAYCLTGDREENKSEKPKGLPLSFLPLPSPFIEVQAIFDMTAPITHIFKPVLSYRIVSAGTCHQSGPVFVYATTLPEICTRLVFLIPAVISTLFTFLLLPVSAVQVG